MFARRNDSRLGNNIPGTTISDYFEEGKNIKNFFLEIVIFFLLSNNRLINVNFLTEIEDDNGDDSENWVICDGLDR